ncbi:MAG: acetylxylan esterase [Bryobacteraceae bacterium]
MRIVALWVLVVAACGQTVPSWITDPILPEPVRKTQMRAFVDANIPPLPRFKTIAEWESYRTSIRAELLRLLGIDDIVFNRKLRFIQTGLLERDGYKLEKINYESFPGMWVPAVIWVPNDIERTAPAVISVSGHTYCESKGADYMQQRAFNLVRRGMIVMTYDYFGTFERSRFDPCASKSGNYRDHLDSRFSYTSRTPTGVEVLDAIRAVDYLRSRHDVDFSRIAFTGESGGGNSTYWAAALDDRIALSIPVSSAGAMEQWIKDDTNYDWHQRPPGMRAIADIGTLYALAAPRPLLAINGTPELAEFSLPDAKLSIEYAREVYRLYGKPDLIQFRESATGHGYQADKRAMLYAWLNRFFFAGKMPSGEQELAYEVEAKDYFKAGLKEDSLSIPALAERWVAETAQEFPVPANADEARKWQREARASLLQLLGPREIAAKVKVASAHGAGERLIFEMEPGLLVPAVFVRRFSKKSARVWIQVERTRLAEKLGDGDTVLAIDPRGTGEVEWGGTRTSNWANFMGRPPVTQWSEDISKTVTWMLERNPRAEVWVRGHGAFGKAVLYAAALDERIKGIAITLDSASYRQEAKSGLLHVYADVPRILSWGDTPQLAALVAPRKVEILGAGVPVSANDEKNAYFMPLPRLSLTETKTPTDVLRREFEWTARFYRAMGVPEALVVH